MRLAEEGFPDAGPSPLSRGIRGAVAPGPVGLRIIPALAGNTADTSSTPRIGQDHPRSRGEYPLVLRCFVAPRGSSPLSRGIRARVHGALRARRIIPALAGNTVRRANTLNPSTDHPRSRGEYWRAWDSSSRYPGSSPLSRGIRVCDDSSFPAGGIIPALARNTCRCT